MATTSPTLPLPEQQQPQEVVPNPGEAVSSSSGGSIGPFFAVMSVLAILTVISCVFGRVYAGRTTVTPLESISHHGGCFEWVKRKCSRCVEAAGDADAKSKAAAAAAAAADEKGSN